MISIIEYLVNEANYIILLRVKIKDVVKMIEKDGWFVVRSRGSHRQFKHKTKKGLVTIAGKPSAEMAPGTLNSVLRQAGLK